MNDPILLTPPEAAELLSISERTLWGRTRPRGEIRAMKVGRLVRYGRRDLEKYVAAKLAGSTRSGGQTDD